jgi:hypothetical protein
MQKTVLRTILSAIFLSMLLSATAQQGDSLSRQYKYRRSFLELGPHKPLVFPEDFVGNWKGQLQWLVNGKPAQTFAMQLIIQPADSAMTYTWQIIYGENGKDNRPYLLKPVDTAKGHWVVDERDGIMLDSYIHGSSFHGAFTVQGNTIVDNYTLENRNEMRVEFFSIKLGDKKTSGKGTEDVPSVDSYKISSYQTGTLIRVKQKQQKKS